jgi:hypothetical protein
MPDGFDEGVTAKYNAGVLQTQRLNDLLNKVNESNINLLSFNEEYGVWNFELNFRCNKQLLQEVMSKLSNKEREDAIVRRDLIEGLLLKYPILIQINNLRSKNGKPKFSIYWDIHKKYLSDFESQVRTLLDKHGLINPEIDDEGLF